MEGREKTGIPSWLNPIRTRPDAPGSDEQSSSGGDDSPAATPNWPHGNRDHGTFCIFFVIFFAPLNLIHNRSFRNRNYDLHHLDISDIHRNFLF
jgi:hypothetical protein